MECRLCASVWCGGQEESSSSSRRFTFQHAGDVESAGTFVLQNLRTSAVKFMKDVTCVLAGNTQRWKTALYDVDTGLSSSRLSTVG